MENQLPPAPPFTREQANEILNKYLKNVNLLKHSFAAEAAMRALYTRFFQNTAEYSEENLNMWGITGLLHDADYEMSKGRPDVHGILLFDYEKNIPAAIKQAI